MSTKAQTAWPARMKPFMLNMNPGPAEHRRKLQAQVERTKGELKGEFRGKRITATIKEISQDGVRYDNNDEGEYKEGKFDFRYMQTNSFLSKPDGTLEWESKGIANTRDGDMLVWNGNGTSHLAGQNEVSIAGEVRRMTSSPRLSALNNTTVRIEGKGNRATGEYSGKAYAK